uniref:Uncharacterized protein n=1 Tax=Picea glauca TaxID=3330 RepID=A0A101LWY6_PICGL|nr:hypothetical protein ABT39_MTgene6316 [Picea glauca]
MDPYVPRPLMPHWILVHCNHTLVVHMQYCKLVPPRAPATTA